MKQRQGSEVTEKKEKKDEQNEMTRHTLNERRPL
jgi:hypothetical protein